MTQKETASKLKHILFHYKLQNFWEGTPNNFYMCKPVNTGTLPSFKELGKFTWRFLQSNKTYCEFSLLVNKWQSRTMQHWTGHIQMAPTRCFYQLVQIFRNNVKRTKHQLSSYQILIGYEPYCAEWEQSCNMDFQPAIVPWFSIVENYTMGSSYKVATVESEPHSKCDTLIRKCLLLVGGGVMTHEISWLMCTGLDQRYF